MDYPYLWGGLVKQSERPSAEFLLQTGFVLDQYLLGGKNVAVINY